MHLPLPTHVKFKIKATPNLKISARKFHKVLIFSRVTASLLFLKYEESDLKKTQTKSNTLLMCFYCQCPKHMLNLPIG